MEGIHPGRWRLLLTMAGTIGVVNSVLAGALAGFAASQLTGHAAVRVLAGVVAFAIVAAAHQHHQHTRFASARSPLGPSA
jgi:NhaP-type Na+/H+ or K+/H+ antiporter